MRTYLVLTALGAICMAQPAAAQHRLVTLNIGGGVTFPQGQLADGADPGWHALAGIAIGSFMQPIGIRVEGAYNRFGADDPAPDGTIASARLNFTYRLPMTDSPFSPYVITGWGAHWLGCSEGCDTDQRFGWNAGLGTRFHIGFRGFLEARFHGVTGKVRYIPVTLGLSL